MAKRKLMPLLLSLVLLPQVLGATQLSSCPNDNPYHLLVNKTTPLAESFVPMDLTIPNIKFPFTEVHEKKYLEATAATALEALFQDAISEGIHLTAISGYRSYTRQAQIYQNNVYRDGQAKADTYSARPGTSEHQSGLAMDISIPALNHQLTARFGETTEGKWLAENAHTYGYIIRYPKGKEHITGYTYEPWHIRYVGPELATLLYTEDLVFEELETCCPIIAETFEEPAEENLEVTQSTTTVDAPALQLEPNIPTQLPETETVQLPFAIIHYIDC